MDFDFDTSVWRDGMGNMKYILMPDNIKKMGNTGYSGAEMDFKTAPSIIESVINFARNGLFGFTLCDDAYRDAVCYWMKSQRNFSIRGDWIVPTHGTIFSVATAIRMTTAPGQGIIIQPPVYYRYEQAVMRLGRKTVYNWLIEENNAYRIDFDGLEKLMSDSNNRLMVLCNPHNPVGRVWSLEDLTTIARLAQKYGIVVFSDEIFAEVTFDGHVCIPYSEIDGASDHGIVSTSLGKTFNLTGINHANLIIPDTVIRENFTKQRNADHYGSIDPLTYAIIMGAYSSEGAAWKDAMLEYVSENARIIAEFFTQHIPCVKISPFQGTFVNWLDWRGFGLSDAELEDFLISAAFFELDMGVQYGSPPGFTRMSIAAPKRELHKSLKLLEKAVENRDRH